jgi:K+-transporting ATPase ATPase C chain
MFPGKANGQLLVRQGRTIGSQNIGQTFTAAKYFHGRPSAAGTGYDAASSAGTNLGPTNKSLIDAVTARVAAVRMGNPGAVVPIDLVTSSASGLDPHISPPAAFVQIRRVAGARGVSEANIRTVVESHIEGRQFGLLGEPRVNVLRLNLALDERYPLSR